MSSLEQDLLWIAFLIEGYAKHCLRNPSVAQAEPLGWSGLEAVLQDASAMLHLLCPNGNGRIITIRRELQYVSFWSDSRPWLVLGVSHSVIPERLMAAIDAGQGTETGVAPIALS